MKSMEVVCGFNNGTEKEKTPDGAYKFNKYLLYSHCLRYCCELHVLTYNLFPNTFLKFKPLGDKK